MTRGERSNAAIRGGLYGLWVAATVAAAFGVAFVFESMPLRIVAIAIIVLIHVSCIPVWLKMQRTFLCSTNWAKQQRIAPEQLKLFGA
jgi:predicted cobalt transporter CbtA